jgi:hypothetical protein
METEEQNNPPAIQLLIIIYSRFFLKLEELSVLLVGAGKVGLEKLTSLLTNSPSTPCTYCGNRSFG